MKEQVAPWMLISAVAVAVILIGFIVFRLFAPSSETVDTATINSRIAKKQAAGK